MVTARRHSRGRDFPEDDDDDGGLVWFGLQPTMHKQLRHKDDSSADSGNTSARGCVRVRFMGQVERSGTGHSSGAFSSDNFAKPPLTRRSSTKVDTHSRRGYRGRNLVGGLVSWSKEELWMIGREG